MILKCFFFQAETFDWRMATLTKRPANLPDKTYGAPVGYAYFDIFNTGSRCVSNDGPYVDVRRLTNWTDEQIIAH